MRNMVVVVAAIFLLAAVGSAQAANVVTVYFTEVDVGPSSQVDLTNQFAAYGLTFDHVYRYIDVRDPWPEDYGISNGWVSENSQAAAVGTVLFTDPTPYVTIDWWTLGSNRIQVDAYDSGATLLDSFIGGADSFGTETLSGAGLISSLTFHDDGGFVSIANITFERPTVPAPGAILLGALGTGLVGWLRRRRAL